MLIQTVLQQCLDVAICLQSIKSDEFLSICILFPRAAYLLLSLQSSGSNLVKAGTIASVVHTIHPGNKLKTLKKKCNSASVWDFYNNRWTGLDRDGLDKSVWKYSYYYTASVPVCLFKYYGRILNDYGVCLQQDTVLL